VPIAKVSYLRALLERVGNTTGDPSHLGQFIPKVESRELDKIKGEAEGQYINSIFDSTPRLGDLLNNVLRWVTSDFVIIQRLALLITYAKHLSGVQTAAVLTKLYMTTMQLQAEYMINFARDSVSANSVCIRYAPSRSPPLSPPLLWTPLLLLLVPLLWTPLQGIGS
jgi:hypothetical protein